MAKKDDQIDETVQSFLREAQKIYNIVKAYVYGSYVKGTAKDWSDIDLAVISPDFSDDLFEDRLQLMRIATSIDDRIEPRPFTEELFDPNDPLVDEIRKTGIRVL